MLQICRLLRGFTHPGTYFEASEQELALFRYLHLPHLLHQPVQHEINIVYVLCHSCSVERFADEMDTLLEITLRSNLVEKLSKALYKCLFEEVDSSNFSFSPATHW